MIRFKICCIQSTAEAESAVRRGASAIGFVSRMPSGHGPISEELIAAIVPRVPPGVMTVLLTCKTRASEIIAQHRRCRTNVLQLVDAVEPGCHEQLRGSLPGIGLIQAVHVTGPDSIREATGAAPLVDAILLDSGNPNLAVKELGGTGRVHDWSISKAICESVGVPVYLAGGLTPGNVAEAVRRVRPFAVDVCSGVRTGRFLEEGKLDAFIEALASCCKEP